MRLILIIFLSLPICVWAQTTYHISVPSATVYGLPNTNSTVNANLKRGDEVLFLKTMESGDWAKIQANGAIGYIEINSIAEGKLEKSVKKATTAKYHVSVFQSAIYKTQNLSSGKIETLSQNSIVEVIGEAGEWGKVKSSTGIGYVYMAHLTEGFPKKEKKTKEVPTQFYSVKFDAKMFDKPSSAGKPIKNLVRGDGLEVIEIVDGQWAKVRLDVGFGYVNTTKLEQEKSGAGGSGGGSNVKMKDIGKAKYPKKVGAICRDGSTDYKVGPNTCSKGNGVKMWIYQAPK